MRGIEATTGPLGQGIATAVGMAIAERLLAAEFGPGLVDHRTWVFAGDGCLMEGVSQEAISLAGHLKLAKLAVVFDDNGTTIDGATSLATSDDQRKRFEASNWATIAVDGHDPEAIDRALAFARAADRPTLIAARTRIGYGAPTKQGKSIVHGAPLGADELAGMRVKPQLALRPPSKCRRRSAPRGAQAGRRGGVARRPGRTGLATAPAAIARRAGAADRGHVPAGLEDVVKRAADETAVAAEAIPDPPRQPAGHRPARPPHARARRRLGATLTDSVLSKPAEPPSSTRSPLPGATWPTECASTAWRRR